jgi:hypothetical protein
VQLSRAGALGASQFGFHAPDRVLRSEPRDEFLDAAPKGAHEDALFLWRGREVAVAIDLGHRLAGAFGRAEVIRLARAKAKDEASGPPTAPNRDRAEPVARGMKAPIWRDANMAESVGDVEGRASAALVYPSPSTGPSYAALQRSYMLADLALGQWARVTSNSVSFAPPCSSMSLATA